MRGLAWVRKLGGLLALIWVGSMAMATAATDQHHLSVPTEETASRPREAWRWTLDERLATRFDPEEMKSRAAKQDAEAAEKTAWRKRLPTDESAPLWRVPGDSAPTVLLEGRKTPELFLTWELFSALLNRAFPLENKSSVSLTMRPIEERAAALGFGRDFWSRLEDMAAPYLRLQAEDAARQLLRSGPDAPEATGRFKMDPHAIRLCRARAQAIADAKAEFGEEAFLRLLYEAVAPEVQFHYLSTDSEYVEQLRFIEGGCR